KHAAHTPAVTLLHRSHLGRACADCLPANGVRVGNGQNHAHRSATEGLRAEIVVLRRFVTQPEFSAVHGKPGDYSAVRCDTAECLGCATCCFIESHSLRPNPDGKPWSDGAPERTIRCVCGHFTLPLIC